MRDALRRLAHVSTPRWPLPAAVVELATPVLSTLRPRVVRAVAVYRAQPPAVRWLLIGAALLAVLGPTVIQVSKPPKPAASPPAAAANATASPVPAAATTPAEAPSVLDRMVQAVTSKPTAKPAAKTEPQLPPELVEPAKTLVRTTKVNLRERRAAALKILGYKPADQVFPYLRVIAELETARSCKARKASIAEMALARDVHYLPTLRRYDRSPHNGCGFLSLSDCYDCIRVDVREALDDIERANPGSLPDADDEAAR